MKYKHLAFILLFIGAVSGYWTIEPKETFFGIVSLICIIVLVTMIIIHIIVDWNNKIF